MTDPEQFKDNPDGHFDFDVADFGEPSAETMLAFAAALDALKELAIATDEVETIRLDDDPNPAVPRIEGELRHYFVPPDFADKDSRFSASIYDAEPEIMAQVQQELSEIVSVRCKDGDRSMSYTQKYGEEPHLYVRSESDRVQRETASGSGIEDSSRPMAMGIQGTPEFMRFMRARIDDRLEARKQGLDKPTEGTMKQLINAINDEISRRTAAQ